MNWRVVCGWLGLYLSCGYVSAALIQPTSQYIGIASAQQWQQINRQGIVTTAPLDPELQTPLASVWKLFVYAYAVSQDTQPTDYACQGQLNDEVYCCHAGESVGMDNALAQSCGLFFQPTRLGISASQWRQFWQAQPHSPAWLTDLPQMQPQTVVKVADLLTALKAIPPLAAQRAQAALLNVTVEGRGAGTIRYFGSGLRVKTWTWPQPQHPEQKMGGFAGWLADGSVVWVAATGASNQILQDWAAMIAPRLQRPQTQSLGQACVQVALFSRYPITRIEDEHQQNPNEGWLDGRYRVFFAQGTQLDIVSQHDMYLTKLADGYRLQGQWELDDYVARVVEREGSVQPLAAARALAIVARTYLLQNAQHANGCYQIADSSDFQRVLAKPPSAAAKAIALWTEGLIIRGQAVRYHSDRSAPHVLSWQQAVSSAQAGQDMVDILSQSYGAVHIASMYSGDDRSCLPIANAQIWLKQQQAVWLSRLQQEDGFELPPEPEICQLMSGRPQVDIARHRIFIPALHQQEDRLSLTHEWLHLAFAWHPRGRDEWYIEQLARQLNGL